MGKSKKYLLMAILVAVAGTLSGCGGTVALNEAIKSGDTPQALNMIKKGADVDALGRGNCFPLTWAAVKGNVRVAKALLKAGAAVDDPKPSKYVETPLVFAVMNNHLEVARLLLDHGANVNQKYIISDGSSYATRPLRTAAIQGNLKMVELLVAHGANLDAPDTAGSTPLIAAIDQKNSNVASYLIAHGTALTLTTNKGETAMHIAAIRGETGMLKALLERGAPIDPRDKAGDTPLIDAIANGQKNTAELLIDKGANVNAATAKGDTPLILAAGKDDMDIVKALVEHSANLSLQAHDMGTALNAAARNDHRDVAAFLILAGAKVVERKQHDAEDVFGAGLSHMLYGDKLESQHHVAKAVAQYTVAKAHFKDASTDFSDAAAQRRHRVSVNKRKSFLERALASAFMTAASNYQAQYNANSMNQIVALRNAHTTNQYFSNYAALQSSMTYSNAAQTWQAMDSNVPAFSNVNDLLLFQARLLGLRAKESQQLAKTCETKIAGALKQKARPEAAAKSE